MRKYESPLLGQDHLEIIQRPADIMVGETFSLTGTNKFMSWQSQDTGLLLGVNSGFLDICTPTRALVIHSRAMAYLPPNTPYYLDSLGAPTAGWKISIPTDAMTHSEPYLYAVSALVTQLCLEISSWGILTPAQYTPARQRLALTFLDQVQISSEIQLPEVPLPKATNLYNISTQIIANPKDKRSIDEWAEIAGMSRRSFTNHFKKETGVSFAVWRQQVRLQVGMIRLIDGQSIKQVAVDLGYPTQSAFSAAFSEYYGVPPKKFIRRNKEPAV